MTTPLPPLRIEPLTPERQAAWLAFFEGPAFADHPAWASCFCQYLHVDHAVVHWATRSADENRRQACERIACGRLQGLLAYRGDEPVGWCNAGPRSLFDALADEPVDEAERVGFIGCFVIAKPHRRQGVARALLDAACASFRAQGLAWAEAMPLDEGETPLSEAAQHHGPMSLFLSAGFTRQAPLSDGHPRVRKRL